jgi:hypothetical protein
VLLSLPSTENLSALEALLAIICESGGARLLKVERVKNRPALVVFCATKAKEEPPTPVALPITELSTHRVRECLLALEKSQSENKEAAE